MSSKNEPSFKLAIIVFRGYKAGQVIIFSSVNFPRVIIYIVYNLLKIIFLPEKSLSTSSD